MGAPHSWSGAFSPHDKIVLRALAIASASLSIVAGTLALYWFLKLRRPTFRHQLVMLLVASDFSKAICELVYPAATIANGSTKSNALCTSTGFLATIFINATDFAILAIAIHTALCIFRPRRGSISQEEAGLYRWRRYVYVSWAIYSVVLAAAAFANKSSAFTSSISWCYLPVRPFYWRIVLSWGPRYIILLFIAILYISIFVHVRTRFRSVSVLFAMSGANDDSSDMRRSKSLSFSHGRKSVEVAELKTHNLLAPGPQEALGDTGFIVPSSDQSRIGSSDGQTEVSSSDSPTESLNHYARKQSVISINLPPQLESRRASVMSLGRGLGSYTPYPGVDMSSDLPATTTAPSHNEDASSVDQMRLERLRIVKQLKHLFIFPIVYFLMWIIPFCFHMTQYHDRYVEHPVVGLSAAAAFIIPLHGFIDVVAYGYNEKPWRSWRFQSSKSRMESHSSSQHNRSDPTDVVAARHQAELMEAERRRAERVTKVEKKGTADWWDLEAEHYNRLEELKEVESG